MRAVAPGALAFLVVAFACGPVTPPPTSSAPVNVCPDHDCGAYVQTGPMPGCVGGTCLVTTTSGNWTLVVSLAIDAPLAPGVTYAVPFSTALMGSPVTGTGTSTCLPGSCYQLPSLATFNVTCPVQGNLLVVASAAGTAGYYLGNIGTDPVALPVTATFRPQWPPNGTSPGDATAFGLPLGAIAAPNLVNSNPGHAPGPGGGKNLFYCSPALPPLVYERTLSPLPPFDVAFPPDIQLVDLTGPTIPDGTVQWATKAFDPTAGTPSGYPTFNFDRADMGSLAGWTAYLRDQTTLRRLSPVARLAAAGNVGVQLLTSHHPPSGDALENAQLVMVPAPGEPMPTWLFTPTGGDLRAAGTYPKLPAATSVSGRVLSKTTGKPVAADLVFDATSICRFAANGIFHDDLSANHDFAYAARIPAGSGSYATTLPLGDYRVTIIPRDAVSEITVVPFPLTDVSCNPVPAKVVDVDRLRSVPGVATVADGRLLAGATVEAVPAKCSDGTEDAPCLPRWGQTTAAADGTYALSLDPGAYFLRVRPAEGSRLPWVVQPLSVGPTAVTKAPPTVVPAPVNAGLRLLDPLDNPAAGAVVRMFETPATGAPYEIGEALTDADGHFDMYLGATGQ